MKITKRDFEFLQDLHQVKLINSTKVGRLFGNYNSAMRRMKTLEDGGFIQTVGFLLNREKVFGLTKKGSNFVGKDYRAIRLDSLMHILACADFYFYIKSKYTINYFEIDEQIDFYYQGKKYKFRPDILLYTDRWYFIEIDLSNRRIKEKVDKWEKYYLSGNFENRFNLFPPIIFVSINKEKVKAIVENIKTIQLNYAYMDISEIQNFNFRYKIK